MSAMSVCKKLILAVAIALFLSLPAPAAAWAAAIPAGFHEWPMKTTDDPKYEWSVKFNLPVDADSVRGSSICVTDNNNQKLPASLTLTAPDTVKVVPAAPYAPGKEYRLFVKGGAAGGVTSGNGSILLKKPIVVPFVVADSDAHILAISNIYGSVLGIGITNIEVVTSPEVDTVKINGTAMGNYRNSRFTQAFTDFKPGDTVTVYAYGNGKLLEYKKYTITE